MARQTASTKVVIEGDASGLLKAYGQVEQRMRMTERASKSVARSQSETFGTRAIGQLQSVIAGYVSMQAAISAVNTALQREMELRREASREASQSEFSARRLAQVSSSEADFKTLLARSQQLQTQQGISENEANRFMFELRSASLDDQYESFANLVGFVDDPVRIIESASKLQTSFRGTSGSSQDVLNRALAGASNVAGVDVGSFALALTQSGASGQTAGFSLEESVAAQAAIAQRSKNIDTAGTQLNALFSSIIRKPELAGHDLRSTISAISAMGLSDDQLQTYIGEERAFRGFVALRDNMGVFDSTLGRSRQFVGDDEISRRIGFGDSDQRTRLSGISRRVEQEAKVAAELLGEVETLYTDLMKDVQTASINQGQSPARRQIDQYGIGFAYRTNQATLGEEFALRALLGIPEEGGVISDVGWRNRQNIIDRIGQERTSEYITEAFYLLRRLEENTKQSADIQNLNTHRGD